MYLHLLQFLLPMHPNLPPARVKVVSLAPLLAEAIRRIHTNESVSSLFNL